MLHFQTVGYLNHKINIRILIYGLRHNCQEGVRMKSRTGMVYVLRGTDNFVTTYF